MKNTFIFRKIALPFLKSVCILVLLTIGISCEKDEEIIDFKADDEILSDQLANQLEDKDYEMIHQVYGKNSELIGTLDSELEPTGILQKRDDHNKALAVVLYQHKAFNGAKQAIYHGGHDLYLRNSSLIQQLRTGLTGAYIAPHCTVEFYAKDNFKDKLATYSGGQRGFPRPFLGGFNDKTRSLIVKCDYPKARNQFMGFVYSETYYRGRAIPFFKNNRRFRPNFISGFKDATISSISRNKYQHHRDNPSKVRKNLIITDPTQNGEIGIWSDEHTDIPHLRGLNNRKLRLDPRTVKIKSQARDVRNTMNDIRQKAKFNKKYRITVKSEREVSA